MSVHAVHLPGVSNTAADYESRRYQGCAEWRLCPSFFSLFQISGILTLIFLHQSGTIKFLVLFLGIPNLQPGQSMLFPFLGPV